MCCNAINLNSWHQSHYKIVPFILKKRSYSKHGLPKLIDKTPAKKMRFQCKLTLESETQDINYCLFQYTAIKTLLMGFHLVKVTLILSGNLDFNTLMGMDC